MPKNDEKQPLLDKDDAKAEYTSEGEIVASGKCVCFSNTFVVVVVHLSPFAFSHITC